MSPSVNLYISNIQSECGDSTISDIGQFDGNDSVCSDIVNPIGHGVVNTEKGNLKQDKVNAALSLPIVATYNLRSLFPKIDSLKKDLLERNVDVGFLTEIWEQAHKSEHQFEIEKMLELNGLQYISAPRAPNKKGVSYGGAAIVVNKSKFTCEKLNINTPKNLEAVWGLLRPKNASAKFKKIIICSFYSPPNKKQNSEMADYIVTTLQMLSSKYPECGLILGADKNDMDIGPILRCGLRLRQVVNSSTRKGAILDNIIMNLFSYYKSPIIVPPIQPDNPNRGKPRVPESQKYKTFQIADSLMQKLSR